MPVLQCIFFLTICVTAPLNDSLVRIPVIRNAESFLSVRLSLCPVLFALLAIIWPQPSNPAFMTAAQHRTSGMRFINDNPHTQAEAVAEVKKPWILDSSLPSRRSGTGRLPASAKCPMLCALVTASIEDPAFLTLFQSCAGKQWGFAEDREEGRPSRKFRRM